MLLLGQEKRGTLSSGEREGGVAAAEPLHLCPGIPIDTSLLYTLLPTDFHHSHFHHSPPKHLRQELHLDCV